MQDFLLIFNIATLKLGVTRYPAAQKVYKPMKKIEKQLNDSWANGTAGKSS
ncbi:hypothetical protein PGT21_012633 [Puccinia graminis f. sp. tritici]|uniref:Uncharacterized protein n=1 Tax=Puccinia graminis f. sp. tritici TaxID=56615 RepID=A0A5B0Q2S2_PUCGR|nr:hypothetical protein PGT21_012633 [Puccinia graminis f. sp. tritici]KAA1124790.1 hypothetical protein PGTUg99_034878 [Puccinia graminis f. sp. tritici]